MKEKLVIAIQMLVSRKSICNDLEDQKLCLKCCLTYVIECIIKGKDNFEVSFEGKYVESFSKRIHNYYRYIIDSIYRFFLIHFTPNDDKTFRKYELIHCGVSKPIHFKYDGMPNEKVLYKFLKENGFKIIGEHLYSESTVYVVARA